MAAVAWAYTISGSRLSTPVCELYQGIAQTKQMFRLASMIKCLFSQFESLIDPTQQLQVEA